MNQCDFSFQLVQLLIQSMINLVDLFNRVSRKDQYVALVFLQEVQIWFAIIDMMVFILNRPIKISNQVRTFPPCFGIFCPDICNALGSASAMRDIQLKQIDRPATAKLHHRSRIVTDQAMKVPNNRDMTQAIFAIDNFRIEKRIRQTPIVLLHDIFSELGDQWTSAVKVILPSATKINFADLRKNGC